MCSSNQSARGNASLIERNKHEWFRDFASLAKRGRILEPVPANPSHVRSEKAWIERATMEIALAIQALIILLLVQKI